MRTFFLVICIALLSLAVRAETNNTTNSTISNLTNSTNLTTSQIPVQNVTLPNASVVMPELNQTAAAQFVPMVDFNVTSVVPRQFKIGDIQFNIQVQNTGNVELKNIMALITGRGFSMYDAVPIDSLKPGEKSYIIVMGYVKEEGGSTLTIRINEKVFHQDISVLDPNSQSDKARIAILQAQEEKNNQAIETLSAQLANLKNKNKELENELAQKKSTNYDVSAVNLEDMKTFLRNAESSIIVGDAKQANASVTLATEEYDAQKAYLDNAQVIKRSFLNIIRENLVLVSTIAGALITMFSLYEILKKKKDTLYQKIKEVQVNKDTRVVVEQKRKKK
ncbi:MAG: hypothetical protein V1837_05125 [Candidatus Woesearchaeota archaeon]